jgi:hypothetical protein
MSRLILFLVLAGFITYGIISVTQNENVTKATENSVQNYAQTKARNVANSTIQLLMSQVADNIDWRVNTWTTKPMFEGEVGYSVKDVVFDGAELVEFSATANVYGTYKNVTAFADKFPLIPPGFRGAITTNNDVVTLGGLRVDGRNHKIDATLVPESGTYAIWTTQSMSQEGNSALGGTDQGTDYPLMKPADPRVIKVYQTYPGGYPTSPDSILGGPSYGYPEGTLKSIAMSGLNGSQYVTDPTTLSYPLKGVTYIELTDKFPHNKWEDANVTGSGILVVHNKSTNARIWNMEAGIFVGMVIVDDLVHVHTTVIGAIVCLTPNPSKGNTIGNSDGLVLYSTEAIRFALKQTNIDPKINYGFGNNRLFVKHWFE